MDVIFHLSVKQLRDETLFVLIYRRATHVASPQKKAEQRRRQKVAFPTEKAQICRPRVQGVSEMTRSDKKQNHDTKKLNKGQMIERLVYSISTLLFIIS
jgi:hypothetical protein